MAAGRDRRPHRAGHRDARLIGVFLLGLALFMPPLLAVASTDATIAGIPLLYLWLFGAWAVLVALLAVVVERGRGQP